jgi:HEAT repeat protein
MRAWKIHVGWGLVALVTAAAWGRWTASRFEPGAGLRLAPETAAPELAPQVQPDPSPSASSVPRAGRPPSTLGLLPEREDPTADEIRVRLKSSNLDQATEAVGLIVHLKDPAQKRELLFECLRSAQPWIRRKALVGLVSVMGRDAVPVVQSLLSSDPEPFVRSQAATLLGELPDKGSTELLLDAYRTGEENLQLAAAASLYRFGSPGPAAELLPGLAVNLDSPDGDVRKDAVVRIGRLQAPIAIPELTRALRDTSGIVRSEAASALGRIDAPEIPDLLAPLLKDPFVDVRESAQDAIEAYRKRHPK